MLPLNFSIIALAFFLCRSKTGTITLDEMASKQNITMSANMSEQCDGTWSGVYIATSSLSFIINFLHLLILRAMPNLRKRNYFWILFGINMADMFSAIFYIISTSCIDKRILETTPGVVLSSLLIIGAESSTLSRYFQLTLASLDRYYALCRPFEYGNSRLLNNTVNLSFLAWTINVLLSTLKVAISSSAIRIGGLGPFIKSSEYSLCFAGLAVLSALLPSIATATFLVKCLRELRQMRKRSLTDEDKEVKNATKYIIITCVLFYSGVFLIMLYMVIKDHLNNDVSKMVFRIHALYQSLYGIANVALFAFYTPAYVLKIRSVFERCCKTKVHPIRS